MTTRRRFQSPHYQQAYHRHASDLVREQPAQERYK